MEYTNIYVLEDPNTGKIRYVGKANDPEERLKNHLNPAKKHTTHKWNWLKKLKKNSQKPILSVIDRVPIEEWQFWEKYWIDQFRQWGFNLTNYMGGGQGTTKGNQTSFKKGQIPWNKGLANTEHCIVCGQSYKAAKSAERKYCSRKCYHEDLDDVETRFSKGHEPWNKNNSGYTLKGNKVYQYSKDKQVLINIYMSCAEASRQVNGNQDAISSCCRGEIKSSAGYYWSYNKI